MARPVLDFSRTRMLLLLAGIVIIGATTVVMTSRGVDSVEVWATVLFLPVFVAAVLWGVTGGTLAAIGAAATYFLLRAPVIELIGFDELAGAFTTRTSAYLVFGVGAGWAAGVVQRSLVKLDRNDIVDDATGLLNARGIAETLGRESARARRYGGVFAVVTARIRMSGDRRTRRERLEQLGDRLRFSLRTVDRVGRWEDDDHGDVLVVVLPETPKAGASFVQDRIGNLLADLDDSTAGDASVRTLGFPDDANAIKDVERLADRVTRAQHPEAAGPE